MLNQLGPYDIALTIGYLLLWVVTLFVYSKKHHTFDGGSSIIVSYIIYACFSVYCVIDEDTAVTFLPLNLFPFLVLYLMLMLALMPLIYHHQHPAREIEDPHTIVVKATAALVVICALLYLPSILSNLQDGLVRLFVDPDAGKDAYEEGSKGAIDSGKSVSNLPALVFNMLSDIGIFLFFYFMSKRKYLWTIALSLPLLVSVLAPIMNGQRGPVMASMSTILMAFFFFKDYLQRIIVKVVYVIGGIFSALVSLPIIAITVSRFGERSVSPLTSVAWYIGQGNILFNNFCLDNGGTRNGDRTMFLIKRLIDPSTPANYVERRIKYGHLKLDDNLFCTFAGDFCIDFGPIPALLIFVLFNAYVVYRLSRFRNPDSVKFHQMLLLFFTACICMQGGMTLFAYADTANLKIVAFMLFYLYLLYHDGLLQRFPREPYTLS